MSEPGPRSERITRMPAGEQVPPRQERFVDTATVLQAFAGATTDDSERFREDLDKSVDQAP